MIIVRILGGLGNQLFQYAMGRAVAYRNNLELKLDLSLQDNYSLRSYELNFFNIEADIATKKEIYYFKVYRRQVITRAVNKARRILLPRYKQKVIKQRGLLFDPDILKVKGSTYLSGDWQSEKYFIDIADSIRKEFTIKNQPDEVNTLLLKKIDSTNAVSLHIRRGDYASNPKTRKFHGVLDLDYYIHALDLITRQNKDAHVFVFSDDIPWARQNFKISLPVDFIDHNGSDKGYEDLRLMSHCKHHIIANSTFSWWGAWLAENPNKMVIAPRRWFAEIEMIEIQKMKIVPEGWIQI